MRSCCTVRPAFCQYFVALTRQWCRAAAPQPNIPSTKQRDPTPAASRDPSLQASRHQHQSAATINLFSSADAPEAAPTLTESQLKRLRMKAGRNAAAKLAPEPPNEQSSATTAMNQRSECREASEAVAPSQADDAELLQMKQPAAENLASRGNASATGGTRSQASKAGAADKTHASASDPQPSSSENQSPNAPDPADAQQASATPESAAFARGLSTLCSAAAFLTGVPKATQRFLSKQGTPAAAAAAAASSGPEIMRQQAASNKSEPSDEGQAPATMHSKRKKRPKQKTPAADAHAADEASSTRRSDAGCSGNPAQAGTARRTSADRGVKDAQRSTRPSGATPTLAASNPAVPLTPGLPSSSLALSGPSFPQEPVGHMQPEHATHPEQDDLFLETVVDSEELEECPPSPTNSILPMQRPGDGEPTQLSTAQAQGPGMLAEATCPSQAANGADGAEGSGTRKGHGNAPPLSSSAKQPQLEKDGGANSLSKGSARGKPVLAGLSSPRQSLCGEQPTGHVQDRRSQKSSVHQPGGSEIGACGLAGPSLSAEQPTGHAQHRRSHESPASKPGGSETGASGQTEPGLDTAPSPSTRSPSWLHNILRSPLNAGSLLGRGAAVDKRPAPVDISKSWVTEPVLDTESDTESAPDLSVAGEQMGSCEAASEHSRAKQTRKNQKKKHARKVGVERLVQDIKGPSEFQLCSALNRAIALPSYIKTASPFC